MDLTLERIFATLKSKNRDQKELADYLGIKPQTITDWKSGKNKSYKKYIIQIAAFLDVSVNYLLGQKMPLPEKATSEEWLEIFKAMEIDELILHLNQIAKEIEAKQHDQVV